MAGKKERQLADEAYRRSLQVTMEQQIAEEQPTRVYPKLDSIPVACPECARKWSGEGGVTPIIRPDAHRQTVFLEQVQCNRCGNVFLVEPDDHEALRHQILQHAEWLKARNAPLPKPKRGKRERGAG